MKIRGGKMRLNDHQILVTGADGFIGSHLAEELLRSGCHVRALVLYNSFNSWGWLDQIPMELRDKLEVFAGDIRDVHWVIETVQGCGVVFHLAALIAIPYSYQAPDSYLETNVRGTLNLLQAARLHKVTKFVHTSTSEVYGTARYVPIDEEHPLQGQSPYAATKIAADQMALAFHRSFGTPVAVIRPFNTYGPRQSARAVIPTVITQLACGTREIKLGALHPTRDFNFISDTVRGFMAVAEADVSVGEVINIGSGYEISIRDLVGVIAGLMGANVDIECDRQRLRPAMSEVERLVADNSKARKLLAWEPEYGRIDGLRYGLAETIDWFSDPDNLKRYRTGAFNI